MRTFRLDPAVDAYLRALEAALAADGPPPAAPPTPADPESAAYLRSLKPAADAVWASYYAKVNGRLPA